MAELVQSNIVQAEQQTLEIFKSLFYFYKSKRDSQIKLYSKNRSFSLEAINTLNRTIHSRLQIHQSNTKLTNITVMLSDDAIRVYGNWEEFLAERWQTTQKTESVTIDWEFEVILPNREHQIPQLHSLKVRMGRGLKPNEFFHLMMIGGSESELEENQSQMVCKVDFVNSIIATDLINDVSNWYGVLPERKKENRIYAILGHNQNRIRFVAQYLILISGVCLCFPISTYVVDRFLISNPNSLGNIIFPCVSLVVLIFVLFDRIGRFLSAKIQKSVEELSGISLFEITTGDLTHNNDIIAKNKSIMKDVALKVIISLVSTFILYLLGIGVTKLLEHVRIS